MSIKARLKRLEGSTPNEEERIVVELLHTVEDGVLRNDDGTEVDAETASATSGPVWC